MILLKHILLDDKPADILIDGSTIARILPGGGFDAFLAQEGNGALAARAARELDVLDGRGKAVIPGFINMHTHAAMSLMRGVMEDVPFHRWLDAIWEIEKQIDADFVYWGTRVACLEMLKSGTTTFNDQYFFPEAAYRAAVETGLRPVISVVILDNGSREAAERQKEECFRLYEQSRSWPGGAQMAVSIHSVYSVSEEMILWATEFARTRGLLIHTHLSETERENTDCMAAHGGLTPTGYLDRLGVLGPDLIAAHSLWLSPHDIELLGTAGVSCVHNINSNAKLASGLQFFDSELRKAGANVCLGTDGAASSNNLDMLETMKTAALFQKAWRHDPSHLPLHELLDMATAGGARALGLDTGVIREGALADLSVVDLDNTRFLSPGSFLANLVYSAHSDCIDSVLVGGKFVMRGRKVPFEQEILQGAREVLRKIQKAG